ncbi:MAG: hypothetical protein SGJ10_10125 [Bacteroidota bacterium]|nr:hypothetical protein [Bacteroidota bacterium]
MKKLAHIFVIIVSLFGLAHSHIYAQEKKPMKRPNRAVTYNFQYTPLKPMGEMGKKFGLMNAIGFGMGYKSNNRWQFGVFGRFMFGNSVTMVNPLQYINTIDGDIINADGSLIQPRYYSRGLQIMAEAGKIFLLNKKRNTGTGILLTFGAGYIHHKLRLEIPGEGAPQLYPDYKHGYDRFHSGLCISQYIAYQYMDPRNRTVNFQIGLELNEAFTVNRRGFNYDERQYDTKTKLDYFPAMRFCWFIPQYLKGFTDDDGYRWK